MALSILAPGTTTTTVARIILVIALHNMQVILQVVMVIFIALGFQTYRNVNVCWGNQGPANKYAQIPRHKEHAKLLRVAIGQDVLDYAALQSTIRSNAQAQDALGRLRVVTHHRIY